jgi:hypothetical protein
MPRGFLVCCSNRTPSLSPWLFRHGGKDRAKLAEKTMCADVRPCYTHLCHLLTRLLAPLPSCVFLGRRKGWTEAQKRWGRRPISLRDPVICSTGLVEHVTDCISWVAFRVSPRCQVCVHLALRTVGLTLLCCVVIATQRWNALRI